MKLNRKTLRKLIKEEIQRLNETQVELGFDHKFTYKALYQRALGYLKQNPNLSAASPEVKEVGEQLLRMLHNAVQKAGVHDEGRWSDDGSKWLTPDKDPVYQQNLVDQGELKIMRNALAYALGHTHSYSGRSSSFGDMIRVADPTGEKQRSGLRPDQVSDDYHDAIGRRYDAED